MTVRLSSCTNLFVIKDLIQGLLLPNEIVTITLTVYVDDLSASTLNSGTRTLEWTLIVHTILGKDLFVAITGEYGKLDINSL